MGRALGVRTPVAMRLTYLAVDSLQEGVGASQILPYTERLAARGIQVKLHTFEKSPPPADLVDRVKSAGIDWRPRAFGSFGTAGGVKRVLSGALDIRGAELVHARSDLAAASACLAQNDHWVWDLRSLFVDQKIELGEVQPGSLQEKVLRRTESEAARRSSAIITLTQAVLPVLLQRYGASTRDKTTIITTCVDTRRFVPAMLPPTTPVRFLLAGTINRYYDVRTMLDLVALARRKRPTVLEVAIPHHVGIAPWVTEAADFITRLQPDEVPGCIRRCHVGLSICREDAGVSLKASMPTKIAEFLACGRPVVVNPGLGDAASLLEGHNCGIAIDPASSVSIRGGLKRLETLLEDRDLADRCRALAETHFDLDVAVPRLISVYEKTLRL